MPLGKKLPNFLQVSHLQFQSLLSEAILYSLQLLVGVLFVRFWSLEVVPIYRWLKCITTTVKSIEGI